MDMSASQARRGSRSVRPKTQLRDGDILNLRTGFTHWHVHASIKEQEDASKKGAFIGLETPEESARWIWNHQFAAVATETLG
ncbi:hypothetical protein FOPE_10927 [Fonsecaea pedrosoi]|nr:hypothetical protein FOPE_10927 [Fonsecaea pedrosoi]